jgi:hypothetical protein
MAGASDQEGLRGNRGHANSRNRIGGTDDLRACYLGVEKAQLSKRGRRKRLLRQAGTSQTGQQQKNSDPLLERAKKRSSHVSSVRQRSGPFLYAKDPT